MGLGDAWTLWLHGQLSPTLTLWGVKIFWWARFGKALQVIAGITILAEIIGAENLRKFGNSLHNGMSIEQSWSILRNSAAWYATMMKYLFNDGGKAKELLAETSKYNADIVNFFVCIALGIAGGYFSSNLYDHWYFYVPVGIVSSVLSMGTLGPIITVMMILAFIIFGSVLDFLFVEPVAWVLERRGLERFTKLFSLALLLIGFHFDFLSS